MIRTGVLLSLAFTLLAACTASEPAIGPSAEPTTESVGTTAQRDRDLADERERMVIDTIVGRGVTDEDVLNAIRAVPRHRFVPEAEQDYAYGDYPLPIGYGQTISQPYIVALMTDLLDLQRDDRVLEVGTGSGYQAAVLAEVPGVEVYTIEIIPELAETAFDTLRELGYTDVQCRQGDGYYGWPEHAPYNAIIVTAAPDHLPEPLVDQLAPGGRIVIPIGPPGGYQTLWRFVKTQDGELEATNMGGVAFVPFTGEHGRQEYGPESGP
jgi:protein-L-isoaspartate(D-aspartate) O-methyltransferase